jgi:hypothetical protein
MAEERGNAVSDDPSIKQRLRRAKKAAIELLEKSGYDIIESNNSTACVVGTRKAETRFIRVVVDVISDEDIKLMKQLRAHRDTCTKEIWLRKKDGFEMREIGYR